MSRLVEAVSFDGLPVLIAAVVVAGLVRGFTGFGTALVYVPLASTVLSPVHVVVSLMVFDIFGPLPLMPRALRDGQAREVARLLLGAVVGLIIGLTLLTRADPVVFRWGVCVLSIVLLLILISGWRHRGSLSKTGKAFLGGASGLLGGAAGLPGPPIILFYLSGQANPATIRANILMYLVFFDVMFFVVLGISGLMEWMPVLIGLLLVIPYGLGGMIGQAIFDPAREKVYRSVSYLVIAAAAVTGLPLFD